MKTVCVFASITVNGKEMKALESAVFGINKRYSTANDFIIECKDMWKKHADSYEITNVVIEG